MSASWHCAACSITAELIEGRHALREAALLAGIHDRLHHGGAATAALDVAVTA